METHTYIITDSDQGVYVVIPLDEYRQLIELLRYSTEKNVLTPCFEPQSHSEPSTVPYTPVTIL